MVALVYFDIAKNIDICNAYYYYLLVHGLCLKPIYFACIFSRNAKLVFFPWGGGIGGR